MLFSGLFVHVLDVSIFHSPDSNHQLTVNLIRIFSFEFGVLEQGNIQNMQGRAPPGPGMRSTGQRWRNMISIVI